jgi:hypothetical protein
VAHRQVVPKHHSEECSDDGGLMPAVFVSTKWGKQNQLGPGYWVQLQFPLGSRIGPGPHWRDSRLGSALKLSKLEASISKPVTPKFKPGPSKVKPRKPKPPKSSAKPNRSGKNEKSAPPKGAA